MNKKWHWFQKQTLRMRDLMYITKTQSISKECKCETEIDFLLVCVFSQESVDLGEIMFSLCYLPTAGRLTLTVIKCRNLKAMDITGYSGVLCVFVAACGCASLTAATAQNEWSPFEYQIVSEQTVEGYLYSCALCLFQQLLIFNTCNIKTLSANSCRRSVYFNRLLFHFSIPLFPAIIISLVKCDIYCALNARVQV